MGRKRRAAARPRVDRAREAQMRRATRDPRELAPREWRQRDPQPWYLGDFGLRKYVHDDGERDPREVPVIRRARRFT